MSRRDDPPAIVVVPVKSLRRAKERLADALDPSRRAALARAMADTVLDAAAPLGVAVACDDLEVAEWARSRGAAVIWTPGTDLNGALARAVDTVASAGVPRAVIAHADLPFARGIARLAEAGPNEVVLVADRHGTGTNVLSIPTGTTMELQFGPDSADAHRAAAARAGLAVVEIHDEALAWDVDDPADLEPPASLGRLP